MEGFYQELKAVYENLVSNPATKQDVGTVTRTLEKYKGIYEASWEVLNTLAAADGYNLAEMVGLMEIQTAQVDTDVAAAQLSHARCPRPSFQILPRNNHLSHLHIFISTTKLQCNSIF